MINGPSTQNRWVTKPCFHICSTDRSRSQAPLYLCTRRAIANRTEGAFGLLRYNLGGNRPSQTTHIALSRSRIHGYRLDFRHNKGGISLVTPRGLTPSLHSLPPILHMSGQKPILCYSKGSRGLSVLPRVSGIFTAATVSPSISLRHCPSRYAIHAGRNLPDKELRYHRTFIVKAAVYRGLSSELRPDESGLTPPLNLPAPGRRQTLYILLRVSRVLCFC